MGRCPGAFAEYALMSEPETMKMPASLDWNQAAALPLTSLVVFDMLVVQGNLKPGEWVFITGVSSGVGVSALTMAKALGARVIGTSGSQEKLDQYLEMLAEAEKRLATYGVDPASARRLNLVGYSGGGAIAALLAAQRNDVSCLVTVAAPLDTDAWVSSIDIAPLAHSLNPLALAPRLALLAQTHIAGAADDRVPARTLQRFAEALPHARMEVIEDYDHDCCWVYVWERLRQRTCLAQS